MEKALKKYIDSMSADGKEEVRPLLQQTSSLHRFRLLMDVRGDEYSGNTGSHIAARENDLETMKCMLVDLTSDQRYAVLRIQAYGGLSALHYAATNGFSSIITYLLTDFSQQQKYNLLQLQDDDGNTPLHRAASEQESVAGQAILTSLSLQHQLQLLNIKNQKGQTVADISPEVYRKHPVLISLGIVILHIILQLKYF